MVSQEFLNFSYQNWSFLPKFLFKIERKKMFGINRGGRKSEIPTVDGKSDHPLERVFNFLFSTTVLLFGSYIIEIERILIKSPDRCGCFRKNTLIHFVNLKTSHNSLKNYDFNSVSRHLIFLPFRKYHISQFYAIYHL